MDLAQMEEYLLDLQSAKAWAESLMRMRAVLLDAIVNDDRTSIGETQDEKLWTVEAQIIKNLKIIHDLQYELAKEFGVLNLH